jgi:hypothetical protein
MLGYAPRVNASEEPGSFWEKIDIRARVVLENPSGVFDLEVFDDDIAGTTVA